VTKIAWEKKQEQIQKTTPGIVRERFVFALPRDAYERDFGTDYMRPHGFAHILGFLYSLLPKIGPLRPLAFKVPTPESEQLFVESLLRTRERFGAALRELRTGGLQLPNLNLDTGKPFVPGEYRLADETMRDWEKHRRSVGR
jgi:hypothetical protein